MADPVAGVGDRGRPALRRKRVVIFVTVGTQLPFDRLVAAVDQWAASHRRTGDVFAQIGPGSYVPKHIRYEAFVQVDRFSGLVKGAELIVSHAGIGSIVTSLSAGKPIVIMPRRADLGEHRNDHQVATASKFLNRSGVFVANDEVELNAVLNNMSRLQNPPPIEPFASPSLISAIRKFIDAA
jgi:UDP-N-acetylglucosamine transferase subunit ALG13